MVRRKQNVKHKKESITFFFPAYFDEKTIPSLVKETNTILEKSKRDYEIIIIDDNSTDNTSKIADKLAVKMKKVRVIHNKENKGYGGTLTIGFSNAKKNLIGFTDGDGQFEVKNLTKFLKTIEKTDIVIGYRKNRTEGLTRKIFHKSYKIYLFLALGMKLKDPDCGFKLLKRKDFKKIKPNSKSGFFSAEMLYNAQKKGLKIKEIPLKHLPRKFGKSKCFTIKEIFTMGIEVFKMYWKKRRFDYG